MKYYLIKERENELSCWEIDTIPNGKALQVDSTFQEGDYVELTQEDIDTMTHDNYYVKSIEKFRKVLE